MYDRSFSLLEEHLIQCFSHAKDNTKKIYSLLPNLFTEIVSKQMKIITED